MKLPEDVALPVETDIATKDGKEFYPLYKTLSGSWGHIRYDNPTFHQTPIYWYFTRAAAERRCTRFKEMIEQIT